MLDYNELLQLEDKVEFVRRKMENEKERMDKLLQINYDPAFKLSVLEDFYSAIKEINDRQEKVLYEKKEQKEKDEQN